MKLSKEELYKMEFNENAGESDIGLAITLWQLLKRLGRTEQCDVAKAKAKVFIQNLYL